ncbi:MAG: dienelactone hydrolase family protein [Verrucomicrobiota bacterium]|nr:dienelactone hydrolase family protein [Verrucomicrobiota bacterium]
MSGTQPLVQTGDLSAAMVEGIGRWLDHETGRIATERARTWRAAAGGGWEQFTAERRAQLRNVLGAIDTRVTGAVEEILEAGAKQAAATDSGYSVHRVRWPVFAGVAGEGLLLVPADEPRAAIIVVPDADELPEHSEIARRLAREGCLVLVPVLVDRRDTWSGNESLQRFTNQPHREWIYRQGFELGRTLISYEVQKIMAAIDALILPASKLRVPSSAIGIFGYGEGGLLALHCAALDGRIRAALVSGYFGPRERLFEEPIYRNVFGLLRDFGDAELAALIAPRRLIVEYSRVPAIEGPPAARGGRKGAAPGMIRTPEFAAVAAEISRANELVRASRGASAVQLITSMKEQPIGPGSDSAARALLSALGVGTGEHQTLDTPPAPAPPEFMDARQRRAVRELEWHSQRLMREAERARDAALWAKLKSGAEWESAQSEARARLWEEVIGKLPASSSPPNPRTRTIRESPRWIGYEVTLDVLPEVFAWGWLLVPRDLQAGERRPVVVCQHGLEGLPEEVVKDDPTARGFGFYKGFAARLAERGFIVYAPHNPYRGGDKFRVLQRRANPLGLSLFSFIIAQHDATTRWLASLPFVDPARIGFYGLSYGGKTAMRVPAVLDRYCLSICSGDFNEWVFKNVTTDARFSYMFTGEYEMPEWNLAHVCNYAEMAMLIAPRPFMVERGHEDGVATDEWVGYEYAKVRRGYTKLGLADRTEIEWFDGPHTIHGVGTFEFLHKHLAWPARK